MRRKSRQTARRLVHSQSYPVRTGLNITPPPNCISKFKIRCFAVVQVPSGQVSAQSSWKSNAAETLLKQGASAEAKAQHKKSASSIATMALYNKFAKFSAISEADALWKQAAEQLALYAAQVPLSNHHLMLFPDHHCTVFPPSPAIGYV